MEHLNGDTRGIIFDNLSAMERMRLSCMFRGITPSQFDTSKELLTDKEILGDCGLYLRAITTGDLEPCVQVMMNITRGKIDADDMIEYEKQVRRDFALYDMYQRVDRIMFHKRYS
jgi:hypothetical protein